MKDIDYTIEKQLSDTRSNEVTYKLVIENKGQNAINIHSISPHYQKDIDKIEEKYISENIYIKYGHLLSKLTTMVNIQISEYLDEKYHKKIKEIEDVYIKNMQASIGNFLGKIGIESLYAKKKDESIDKIMKQKESEFEATRIEVRDSSHAKSLFDQFIKRKQDDDLDNIFTDKINLLERIEKEMNLGNKTNISGLLEPGDQIETLYIFKGKRGLLSPKKYQIDINISYTKDDSDSNGNSLKTYHKTIPNTMTVSPNPFTLSIVSVLSSMLGILLEKSMELTLTEEAGKNINIYNSLMVEEFISATILAFVFFNIYEHTALGRELTISVSWRGALLIGLLCGLLRERILAVIISLLGI